MDQPAALYCRELWIVLLQFSAEVGLLMKSSEYHGLLVVDKPGGVTSRDVVNRVQNWFPRGTPIGHTGTLDPLATGVLVLCLGKATRLAEYVQRMKKTYVARLLLGATSDTDDADGIITPSALNATPPDRETVDRCSQEFVGEIDQLPPAFSAAKVGGQRAYDLARRGREIALESRPVRIYSIKLLHYDYPSLELCVDCGKGTYIRSLARDLGQRLGVGAFVETLRRTRVGPFSAEEAVNTEMKPADVHSGLLPLSLAVSELPRLELDTGQTRCLAHGQTISLCAPGPQVELPEGEVAVFDPSDRLIAIAISDSAKWGLRPLKVLS
jgi:tRNA pseudouridine55 synthase